MTSVTNIERYSIGLGFSESIATIDFETYSEAGYLWSDKLNRWEMHPYASKYGLPAVGIGVYARHPSTAVLSLAYDLMDGNGIRVWKFWHDYPKDLLDYISNGGLIEAWNIFFEYQIWQNVCVPKHRWPTLNTNQLRCAMGKSRAFGLPGSLKSAGNVLNTKIQKDKNGDRLIKLFSQPRNPTKADPRRTLLWQQLNAEESQLLEDFHAYNKTDVLAEMEISKLIPDLENFELQFWKADFNINARGVGVDLKMAEYCKNIIEQAYAEYNTQLIKLTGGIVKSPTQLPAMRAWLSEQKIYVDSLDETAIEYILKNREISDTVRQVLELRRKAGSSAVKKLYTLLLQAVEQDDQGRLYGLFMYHSARTGRATGVGVQPQNLPNSGIELHRCLPCGKHFKISEEICPWCENISEARNKTREEWNINAIEEIFGLISNTPNYELLEYYYGDPISVIYGCLRSLFIAKRDHDLICSDYSAIESVVLSVLAGEKWRIEVFQTHGKIYEMSASKISGVPFDEIVQHKITTGQHHPLRKLGKVAELASGYQGAIGGWKKFGADEFLTDDQIKDSVKSWRAANPAITAYWYELEKEAKCAIRNPGTQYGRYLMYQNVLYSILPSGRKIAYQSPSLVSSDFGEQISYKTWNTNAMQGPIGWISTTTYGGKLAENNTQATARDILAHGIVSLENRGYPVVLHVHDEIVCEIPEDFGTISEFEFILNEMPAWAKNWPIKVGGSWRGKRYRK